MGRTIRIEDEDAPVTIIEWLNQDDEVECLEKEGKFVEIHTSPDDMSRLYAKDIPKLIKALEIAMVNGWHKDE